MLTLLALGIPAEHQWPRIFILTAWFTQRNSIKSWASVGWKYDWRTLFLKAKMQESLHFQDKSELGKKILPYKTRQQVVHPSWQWLCVEGRQCICSESIKNVQNWWKTNKSQAEKIRGNLHYWVIQGSCYSEILENKGKWRQ